MAELDSNNRIDYIELNVADIQRSKAFYGTAFGWSLTDFVPTYCEFADGRLTGGFTTNGLPTPGGPSLFCTPTISLLCSDKSQRLGVASRNRSSASLTGSDF